MTTLLATFKNVRVFLIFLSSIAFAQTQTITQSANDFLTALDAKTKAKTIFALSDPERFNWYFVPREKREGACFKYFNIEQRQAALSLLRTALSEAGYRKATEIMALENVLREIENRTKDDTHRDPLNYYFTFFGNPSEQEPWAWRIEGHHFVINFAIDKGLMISGTPAFFGSNPGIVLQGEEKGKQILKLETNLAFALVNSLTADQKTKAVFAATALPEIISGNNRKAVLLSPVGIPYTELTPQQKQMFDQLLNAYVSNYELGFSKTLMDKIKRAGLENLSFAWAGSFTPGVGHYYRIQGPMLLIEYDNTQNNANHVHTTVRDLTNDFAEDILREHYQHEHK